MLSFSKFLNEAKTSGVDFEWAIIYWSLKESGMSDEEISKRHPKILPYSGKTRSDAKKAIKNIPKELLSTAKHSDEIGIVGSPEPKTDIVFGKNNEIRVSVKMSGMVQLASGEGKSTAAMLNFVSEEFEKEVGISDSAMKQIIEKIEKMPNKMVSPQNVARLEKEKPELLASMKLSDGSINPNFNWRVWESEHKEDIKRFLAQYVANHPKFAYILVHETLTGHRTFSGGLASSNYIMTPNKFVKIDDNYVNEVISRTKIDLRAKSRKGITSATIRFDYKTESVMIENRIWRVIKKYVRNFKSIFKRILPNLFDRETNINVSIKL